MGSKHSYKQLWFDNLNHSLTQNFDTQTDGPTHWGSLLEIQKLPLSKKRKCSKSKTYLTLINYSRACLSSVLACSIHSTHYRSNLCLEIPELKDRKKWPVTPNKKPPETPMYSSLYFRKSDELSSKWLFSTLMNCHLGSIGHGVVDRDILWEGGS